MKYIYQKRTLHSFPDYLKLKLPYSHRLLGSLSPSRRYEICLELQLAGSRPTYSIVCTLCTWKERL